MTEHPILFSTPMVQALLAGRKTQTRRIVKPQPEQKIMGGEAMNALTSLTGEDNPLAWHWKGTRFIPWPKFLEDNCCTYGKPGDRLWVRESFLWLQSHPTGGWIYKADDHSSIDADLKKEGYRWRPSIHMLKKAARIWLEVTNVRAERLHDITEQDAKAEGVLPSLCQYENETEGYDSYIGTYIDLWGKINGKESWKSNPWVWVIEFKVLSTTGKPKNIDTLKERA